MRATCATSQDRFWCISAPRSTVLSHLGNFLQRLDGVTVICLPSQMMDISQASCWKPGGSAYMYAAHRLQLKPSEVRTCIYFWGVVRFRGRESG